MNDELVEYILAHENQDISKLLLKQRNIFGYSARFVANQINGRRRAKDKLPTWYSNPNIKYPPQQNLEQCSSEATAKFKAQIIREEKPGNTLVDLMGGFGIDTFFFSKVFENVTYVEPNKELSELAISNHRLLNATNIVHIHSSAEEFLKLNQKFDWIYLDPSRQSKGRKVVQFSDCEPDVLTLLPKIFQRASNILLKASPLLDLKEGIRLLPGVKKLWVVSIDNECKELLFWLDHDFSGQPKIICVNLPDLKQNFEFFFDEEAQADIRFEEPKEFLYEPNASILKAGAFKIIAARYGLRKVAMNTHFYTGPHIKNFPGRIFKSISTFENLKTQLPGGKANIISRNHPLTPAQIKRKFKLKDGGNKYILAFSGIKKRYLIIADRVK